MEALQYPIGRFQWETDLAPVKRREWIRIIADTPRMVRAAVDGLDAGQLDTRYRDGGWTVRQVVHHYADDHMNSYMRFKLALTEENPPVQGFSEAACGELPDAVTGPIEPSLHLLEALHSRWVAGWESLEDAQWARGFVHPKRGFVSLDQLAALYHWHGRHHVAQIVGLRERNGW
jgi:hypothetical protein